MSTVKAKQFHLIEDLDIAAMVFAAVESVEDFAAKTSGTLRMWMRRSNERRLLAQMSARLQDDIGLTPHEIDLEVAKFFWQK